jgi:hypothetical protein
VRWLQSLRDALPADDDASSLPIPDFSAPSPQRRAELAVYASPEVHALVQSIVSDGTPPHRGKRSSLPLHWQVEGAIDAIREKLQGRTPLPYEREPTRRVTRIHPQRWRIVISDQGIYPEVMHHAERDQARRGNGGASSQGGSTADQPVQMPQWETVETSLALLILQRSRTRIPTSLPAKTVAFGCAARRSERCTSIHKSPDERPTRCSSIHETGGGRALGARWAGTSKSRSVSGVLAWMPDITSLASAGSAASGGAITLC